MTVDVTCDRVKEFKSQLTITIDNWSRAITVIDGINPVVDEENRSVWLFLLAPGLLIDFL